MQRWATVSEEQMEPLHCEEKSENPVKKIIVLGLFNSY
jgi:hypothetical protein